jgi:hypothetical protein
MYSVERWLHSCTSRAKHNSLLNKWLEVVAERHLCLVLKSLKTFVTSDFSGSGAESSGLGRSTIGSGIMLEFTCLSTSLLNPLYVPIQRSPDLPLTIACASDYINGKISDDHGNIWICNATDTSTRSRRREAHVRHAALFQSLHWLRRRIT